MLTIYGVPPSVHTRKVVIAALQKKIAYRVEPVIPFQPPPDWAKLSPTGLIPVMDDAGFRLADSTAICHYLERKHPDVALLPREARDVGRAMWFDAYAGGALFRNIIQPLFFQRVIRPRMLKEETDRAMVEDLLANAQPKVFGYLNDEARGTYLVGDRFSIADLAIVSNLINYQYLGYTVDRTRYPNLAALAQRTIARSEFQTALAAEKPFAEQLGLDRAFLT
jgi:glutathione S-transferase